MLTFTKPDDGTSSVRLKLAQSNATATDTVWLFDEVTIQEGADLATAFTTKPIDDTIDNQPIYGAKEFYGETLFRNKVKFTQTDGNEYIDSDADGYVDLHATTATRAHTGFVIPSGTTPAPAVEGAIFLDTDAGANGTLVMYSNGGWRTIQAF